ncbi:competence protein ComK [Thermolongibacillus altinsuensis]|uniref:Competence protein ComK n=1 Tax=Thermolongibacillus altinsuensis TaxID=575256 RepID=A0A4R1QQ73_9BACL|nr:competence protein ComK [Thermolongibacillus altinsuensis]TCL51085.1 competence protein ComK [Thermolongibacillus altinsuensis]
MKISEFLVVNDFAASRYTMGIFPIHHHTSVWSKVIEEDGEYMVQMRPIDVIEQSCLYYGASLKGRKDGTKEIIGISHKAPLAIEPSNEIFFFPTISPSDPQCIWLSHLHIHHHEHAALGKTRVTFSNGHIIELNISHHSFVNQLHRTAQLRTKLRERLEARERKLAYMFHLREKEQYFS